MTFRRSEIYAPLAALLLSLVGLISTTSALNQATDSLEKTGQRFTDTHKAPQRATSLLLAGLSAR